MRYKDYNIMRVLHNGYYASYTIDGRILADTLEGIKKLIDKDIEKNEKN